MSISREEVLRIARLARIELDEAEIERLKDDLGSILEYVEKLDELDLDGVEPQTHATQTHATLSKDGPASALREDKVEQTIDRDAALSNAPDTEDGHFRVPKVVED